jgi:hypothetical protein
MLVTSYCNAYVIFILTIQFNTDNNINIGVYIISSKFELEIVKLYNLLMYNMDPY